MLLLKCVNVYTHVCLYEVKIRAYDIRVRLCMSAFVCAWRLFCFVLSFRSNQFDLHTVFVCVGDLLMCPCTQSMMFAMCLATLKSLAHLTPTQVNFTHTYRNIQKLDVHKSKKTKRRKKIQHRHFRLSLSILFLVVIKFLVDEKRLQPQKKNIHSNTLQCVIIDRTDWNEKAAERSENKTKSPKWPWRSYLFSHRNSTVTGIYEIISSILWYCVERESTHETGIYFLPHI